MDYAGIDLSNLNPMQGAHPAGTPATNKKTFLEFQGKLKLSDREPEKNRPVDPSEIAATRGASYTPPVIRMVPEDAALPENAVLLNGTWTLFTGENEEKQEAVPVPGELAALGYSVYRDRKYHYRKELRIPEDWKDHRIFLQFGRVHEACEIFADGKKACAHRGANTTFDCELTDFVVPGQQAILDVFCWHTHDATDGWVKEAGSNEPGSAGITDDVTLFALPVLHLNRLHVLTELDGAYANAVLVLELENSVSRGGDEVKIRLADPQGNEVFPASVTAVFPEEQDRLTLRIPVALPEKWDAEHPNLYTLQVSLGTLTYTLRTGFRKIERIGDNLYVNGKKTKLRGAAFTGGDPVSGRLQSAAQLEDIVRQVKWANMNYLRTPSSPGRKTLLDLCDTYGIYVEECMPINFQRGTWDSRFDLKTRPSSNLPAYEELYLSQTAEVVEHDRNHPSIIIWQYGNESDWGMNIRSMLEYIAKEDPTRLTSGTWEPGHTSISSYHYPRYDETLAGAALYDEYAHVPCYSGEAMFRDPGIRNAWGESVRRGWEAIVHSPGTVGCAVFALSDSYLELPDGRKSANFCWGMLDAWGRKKPELFLAKKGFSPVKLPDRALPLPEEGMPLAVPVENRYNNTNLKELRFTAAVERKEDQKQPALFEEVPDGVYSDCVSMEGPDLPPMEKGALVFPFTGLQAGDRVLITASDREGLEVDRYLLTLCGEETPEETAAEAPKEKAPYRAEETGEEVIFDNGSFRFVFSKESGLIASACTDGKKILSGGPYLNMNGAYYKSTISDLMDQVTEDFTIALTEFKKESFSWETDGRNIVVRTAGVCPGGDYTDRLGFHYGYEAIRVRYVLTITPEGRIRTDFTVDDPPKWYLYEVGISYLLPEETDAIAWKKESVYSGYPADHIGRPEGQAKKHSDRDPDVYREKPRHSWSLDEVYRPMSLKHRGLRPRGTNDFIATREDILWYEAGKSGDRAAVRVLSEGEKRAVRICPLFLEHPEAGDEMKLTVNTELYYDMGGGSSAVVKSGDGYLGNYTYPEILLNGPYASSVVIELFTKP